MSVSGNILKPFLKIFFYDHIFIAFCAVALIKVSELVFFGALDLHPVDLFVFFSTLTVYNFHKSLFLLKDHSLKSVFRLLVSKELTPGFRMLMYVSVTGSCFAFFFLDKQQILYATVLFIIVLGYSLPLITIKNVKTRIREVHYIKVVTIAFVWAAATVLLPLCTTQADKYALTFLFLERFLFVFAITVPFEIRDMQQEALWGNKTIPAMLGVRGAKVLAHVFLILFCLLIIGNTIRTGNENLSVTSAFLLSTIPAFHFIYTSNENKSPLFYKFYGDGTMMLQFIFVFLSSIFV